jgi:hypothetical protein
MIINKSLLARQIQLEITAPKINKHSEQFFTEIAIREDPSNKEKKEAERENEKNKEHSDKDLSQKEIFSKNSFSSALGKNVDIVV